ncbi:hypothetical protein ES703_43290 [subsurface metagenome]
MAVDWLTVFFVFVGGGVITNLVTLLGIYDRLLPQGPRIELVETDKDSATLVEGYRHDTRWIYHLDLVFHNSGDREGVLHIDKIAGGHLAGIAPVGGPKPYRVGPSKYRIVRFRGSCEAFSAQTKKDTSQVTFRTWKFKGIWGRLIRSRSEDEIKKKRVTWLPKATRTRDTSPISVLPADPDS